VKELRVYDAMEKCTEYANRHREPELRQRYDGLFHDGSFHDRCFETAGVVSNTSKREAVDGKRRRTAFIIQANIIVSPRWQYPLVD